MKLKSLTKISIVFLFTFVSFVFLTTLSVSANSGYIYAEGVTASGAIIGDEKCPVIVESELLTFDIQEFPEKYYDSGDDFLAYDGKVTAEYSFYNPSDHTVKAVLLFPFGAVPEYAVQSRYDENDPLVIYSDTEKYTITIDGKPIEKRLRYTYLSPYSQFDFEEDTSKLVNGYITDDFYSPELSVTKYTYSVDNLEDSAEGALLSFSSSIDETETLFLVENLSATETTGNSTKASLWVNLNTCFSIYAIGKPVNPVSEYKFYEDSSFETELSGNITLTETETMQFKDLALYGYDETSGRLEYDWYNAAVTLFHQMDWEDGFEEYDENLLSMSGSLMRWYEYEISLDPDERIVNTVTAPVYPSIDMIYDPYKYEYSYLLSPAKTWNEFGNLEIVINTPYYLSDSSINGFKKNESGYTLSLDELPENELDSPFLPNGFR